MTGYFPPRLGHGSGTSCKADAAGFLLVEAIPALALLLLALLVAWRMVWVADQVRGAEAWAAQREGLLPWVWEQWPESAGPVAMAILVEGSWQLTVFPDETWLPPVGRPGPGEPVIFKRLPREGASGAGGWEIWHRHHGSSGETFWRPMTVLVGAAPGEERP